MNNLLLPDLPQLLESHPEGISEHEMLKFLSDHPAFDGLGESGQLPLFQKHFLLMNALYQLQRQFWQEQRQMLTISPLRIVLGACATGADERAPAIPESPGLSDYYLDWRNFFDANEEDVQALLEDFWIRFSRFDRRAEALALLELEAGASQQQIKRRYRELVNHHHPDKGGDRDRFVRIRQAYELLT